MRALPKDTELVLTKLLRETYGVCRGEHQAWDVWASGWLDDGRRPTAAVHRRALDYATGFVEGVRLSLWITDWQLAETAFDGKSPGLDARYLRARAREEVARAFARGIGARRVEVQEQLVGYARQILLLAKKATKASPVRNDLLNVPASGDAWRVFYGSR